MKEVVTVGTDVAKNVFQVHSVDALGIRGPEVIPPLPTLVAARA